MESPSIDDVVELSSGLNDDASMETWLNDVGGGGGDDGDGGSGGDDTAPPPPSPFLARGRVSEGAIRVVFIIRLVLLFLDFL